jgi:hypothetical protein
MFDHGRSLVQHYQGRPFVLLGVNVDARRETLVRAEQKANLTWRSWWDGPAGPIAREWKVTALPTVCLIDHEGRVRYECTGAPDPAELDRRVEALVREAEGARQVASAGARQ